MDNKNNSFVVTVTLITDNSDSTAQPTPANAEKNTDTRETRSTFSSISKQHKIPLMILNFIFLISFNF
ncbi:hypothetical protein AMR94_15185 [Bacillus sp. G3(2015)]|nr:hypothetical protein AMR94_15185 [Bacillus sp. G3(2015)]